MDSVARSLTVFKGSITAREGVLETNKKKKTRSVSSFVSVCFIKP
jgi:hypothetical protein